MKKKVILPKCHREGEEVVSQKQTTYLPQEDDHAYKFDTEYGIFYTGYAICLLGYTETEYDPRTLFRSLCTLYCKKARRGAVRGREYTPPSRASSSSCCPFSNLGRVLRVAFRGAAPGHR